MPQLTVKTAKFQEMMSKALKGAGDNKHLPITSLLEIDLSDSQLKITSTDGANYLTIIEDKFLGEDFNVVVGLDFAKLVAKTSVDTMKLDLDGKVLKVEGNGNYLIELPLDEEGSLITYPNLYSSFDEEGATSKVIYSTSIKTILTNNKVALAETMETPCYTNYYFGEAVVTTNVYKICHYAVDLFGQEILLPANLVSLLAIIGDEKINCKIDNGMIKFYTSSCIIYGMAAPGLEDFRMDAISDLVLNTEYNSYCKVPKGLLLSAIDRLSIFVNQYDKNGIILTFTNDGIVLKNMKDSGTELIKYLDSNNYTAFSCPVDIVMFKEIISAQETDTIQIYYGDENALKFTTGKVTLMLSTLFDEDDEESGEGPETSETDE